MQGRLSPPIGGRIQAFPADSWETEFPVARRCGFDAIEWVFEAEGFRQNPLWSKDGVERIRQLSAEHAVRVPSVCADYFMVHGFVTADVQARRESLEVLLRLIHQAGALGMERILIPILEDVAIRTEADKARVYECLAEALPHASEGGLQLGLETELPAEELLDFVYCFPGPRPGVYYDLGNAAAMGYDLSSEIRLLGRRIIGVHIKDRRHNGPTVPLGTGGVDFPAVFGALDEVGYKGPYILQGARGADDLQTAKTYLEFVRQHLYAAQRASLRGETATS